MVQFAAEVQATQVSRSVPLTVSWHAGVALPATQSDVLFELHTTHLSRFVEAALVSHAGVLPPQADGFARVH